MYCIRHLMDCIVSPNNLNYRVENRHKYVPANNLLEGPKKLVEIKSWLKSHQVVEYFPCKKINRVKTKCVLLVTSHHLVVLRMVPDENNCAEIIVNRPLSSIVEMTGQIKRPKFITFIYRVPDGESQHTTDMDTFMIPNAFDVSQIVSNEIYQRGCIKKVRRCPAKNLALLRYLEGARA